MKRKAKELQLAKREARKGGGRGIYTGGFGGGFGSQDFHGGGGGGGMGPSLETLPPPEQRSSYAASRYTCD